MKKIIVFYITLYLITILTENFSVIAQDASVFTRERPSDLKIQAFCSLLDRDTELSIPDFNVAFQIKKPSLDNHLVTSNTGEGLIYQGNNDPFPVSMELKKEGYLPQSIVSGNFLQEDNYRFLTLTMEPIPEETLPFTGGDDKVRVGYHIIVGSFRDLLLAQKIAEKLKNDFNTNVIVLAPTEEGYYRISYGEYSTLEEAKSTLENIRATTSSDIWIYSEKK